MHILKNPGRQSNGPSAQRSQAYQVDKRIRKKCGRNVDVALARNVEGSPLPLLALRHQQNPLGGIQRHARPTVEIYPASLGMRWVCPREMGS